MKIGILIDTDINTGGGSNFISEEISIIKELESKLNNKINFVFIFTNKKNQSFFEKKIKNTLYFNKNNLINRFSLFLNKIDNIRKLVFKLKINTFQNFINNNKIDFLIFLSPSNLVFCCRFINFVSTIWEIQYKNYPFLIEYKNIHNDIKERDNISKFISLYSYKIFVGTQKSKEDFSYFYRCDPNNIIKKFTNSTIIKSYSENEINEKIKYDFKYFYYPAQFWSHKNHLYIVRSFKEFKKNEVNIKCIFSGADKGFLKNIKEEIKKNNLENYFIIHNYLNNSEVAQLYKNSYCILIPTIVGTYTFPHIEAFFFKKIIFGNNKNLDQDFKDKIINLDLNDHSDLYKKYSKIDLNENFAKNMIERNRKFYDDNFKEEKILNIYKDLISNYINEN